MIIKNKKILLSMVYTLILQTAILIGLLSDIGEIFIAVLLSALLIVLSHIIILKLYKIKLFGGILYFVSVILLTFVIKEIIYVSGDFERFFTWFFFQYGASGGGVWRFVAACIITLSYLLSSAVYYFSIIRYRTTGLFLITVFSLVLCIKREYNPSQILMLVAVVVFILICIVAKDDKDTEDRAIIGDSVFKKGIAAYLVVLAVVIMLAPKPKLDLSTGFIDMLAESLNEFMTGDTESFLASRDIGNYNPDFTSKIVVTVNADEPLYLRSQVFQTYKNGQWQISDDAIDTGTNGWEGYTQNVYSGQLLKAMKEVKNDTAITEKYGLKELDEIELSELELKTIDITYKEINADYMLTPLRTISAFSTYHNEKYPYRTKKDEFYFSETITKGENYLASYAFNGISFEDYCSKVNMDNFDDFLEDIDKSSSTPINTYEYLQEKVEAEVFFLGAEDKYSDKIVELAKDIVGEETSMYVQARMIEEYFNEAGYIYSLKFTAPKGRDVMEYFLFEAKSGCCVHYATAMTLMLRSLGIPARYSEGYIMIEEGNEEGTYVIRQKHAHAYVEAYIPGQGWLLFEPTQLDYMDEDYEAEEKQKKDIDIKKYYKIAVIGAAVIAIIIVTRRLIFEGFFRIRYRLTKNINKTKLLHKRIRKIIQNKKKIEVGAKPLREIQEYVIEQYEIDIEVMTTELEKQLYSGNEYIAESDKQKKIFKEYKQLYKRM